MDGADRVVRGFIWNASEFDASRFDGGDPELQQAADRCLRQVTVDNGPQVVDARHGESLGRARAGLVPRDGARALRPPGGRGLGVGQFCGHLDSLSLLIGG